MNALQWSFRAQCLTGFLFCTGLLAYAIFLQLHQGLEPCPLCIFQRIAFAVLGILFLIAGLYNSSNVYTRKAYGLLIFLTAAIGTGIAGRHVWVQLMPHNTISSCGSPLSFLSETMGPFEVFRTVLTGTSDCGNIDWRFLGLSMPMWSMFWFVALALLGLLVGFKAERRKPLFS
ncbi:disulfide bond formation protein B [Xylella fastidiosa]|uniref:Disulfide bond formation protein B n=2 Tax=Xylella fastidiosa TaxID=2371 RepID=DSBB_XYLFA|nr:disulfide bond formation protein B [Xylella fastidiosa]Q9PGG2.1 RecName: Full=Disulfide bond formation protein B; AltName: Full=Disulfide oxidoreductase [Xylella fastidiosa 9a5c]AAF83150.1 disulfide bond formation protein B [Xylella fastidiosa 9a5c]ALQ94033.1 disulfide bond formation protein B [Xylella fastidiosa]ALQ96275.1 disulfide bond formation protein B [Xylella fastidiosa]ALR01125.1 disulfide bond formation protein B [Xylella fastidiosa]ALR03506.1 disulfide bond formation protein B [